MTSVHLFDSFVVFNLAVGDTSGADSDIATLSVTCPRMRTTGPEMGRRAATHARRTVCGWLAVLLLTAASTALIAPDAQAESRSSLSRAEVQRQQWWISRLGLRDVWKKSTGAGVTVAVIDSGVDASFGDLRGAVLPGFAVGARGNGRQDVDPRLHGTRMADNIAGRGTGFGLLGVARDAKILPVAASVTDSRDAMTALNRLSALPHPPDVVNMSFGSIGECPSDYQDAVRTAVKRGMILVASAGNEGSDLNPSEYPANCVGVVSVGAFGNDLRAWSGSQRQPYVSLAAPGVHIVGYDATAASHYGYANGTSDSAAFVSGIMAVVKARFPKESSRRIVARVLYTARQFDGAPHTRNNTWGFGAARVYNAIFDKVPSSAPNPIYDALDKLAPSTDEPSGRPPSSTATVIPPGAQGSSSTGPKGVSGTSDKSFNGPVIAIVVGGILALAVVALAVLLRRRRRRG